MTNKDGQTKIIYSSFILDEIIYILSKIRFPYISSFFFRKDIWIFVISALVLLIPISAGDATQISNQNVIETTSISTREYSRLFLLAVVLLLSACVIKIVFEIIKIRSFALQKIDIVLVLFFISSEITFFYALSASDLLIWLTRLIYGLIIYFIFSRIKLNKIYIKVLLCTFFIIVVIQGLLAYSQTLLQGLILIPFESANRIHIQNTLNYIVYDAVSFRSVGTLSHPNQLSSFLAIIFPLSISSLLHKSAFVKRFAFVSVWIGVSAAFITMSRWGFITNIFAGMITCVFLYVYEKRELKKNVNFLKISIFIFLTAFMFELFFMSNNRLVNISIQDTSLSTRSELIFQAIYVFIQNPFGVGAGNFVHYLINYDITATNISYRFPAPVHSFYLLILVELGIQAVLLVFILIKEISMSFFKQITSWPSETRLFLIGLFCSLLTFFFNGIWEMTQFTDRVGYFFFLFLGLYANIIYSSARKNRIH